jgi:hypothetical protein
MQKGQVLVIERNNQWKTKIESRVREIEKFVYKWNKWL